MLERTRELGLLRAVGMTRRQVRRLVQLALFLVLGAVTGVAAAVFPARRAARLEVLQAIATQ